MGAIIVFAREILPPAESEQGKVPQSFTYVDEIFWGIGYVGLDDLKSYCEQSGVSTDLWPDYVEIGGDAARISLDEVFEKNRLLREQLLKLDAQSVKGNYHLPAVINELQEGKLLFIH